MLRPQYCITGPQWDKSQNLAVHQQYPLVHQPPSCVLCFPALWTSPGSRMFWSLIHTCGCLWSWFFHILTMYHWSDEKSCWSVPRLPGRPWISPNLHWYFTNIFILVDILQGLPGTENTLPDITGSKLNNYLSVLALHFATYSVGDCNVFRIQRRIQLHCCADAHDRSIGVIVFFWLWNATDPQTVHATMLLQVIQMYLSRYNVNEVTMLRIYNVFNHFLYVWAFTCLYEEKGKLVRGHWLSHIGKVTLCSWPRTEYYHIT